MWHFLKHYTFRYYSWFIWGFLSLLLTNYILTLIPRKIEAAVDLLQMETATPNDIKPIVVSILFLGFALLFIRTLSRLLIFYPGRFVEYDLRNDLLRRLLILPESFYRQHPKGDLMSRLINDLQNLRLMVGFAFLHGVNTIQIFTLVFYQMCLIHVPLALIAILPVPLFLLFCGALVRRMHQSVLENQSALGRITDYIVEAFSGISVIKSFNAEDAIALQFQNENSMYRDKNIRLARFRATLFPLLHIMGSIGNFLVFLVGGTLVIRGSLTLGAFTAFGFYVVQLAWPSAALGWIINIIQRGMASLRRVQTILDAEPPLALPRENPSPMFRAAPRLEVRNLTFGFENQPQAVLKGVQFTVPPGGSLGIFGPTGSGKSVLASLLARREEVPPNTILYDGIPMENIPPEVLWQALSYVPQDSFLFSETIGENIAYWKCDGEGDVTVKVRSAARRAGLERDLLQFPKGVETLVGEKGILLSGGQKHRTALARAFYKTHVLLVLDDILASVDHETEQHLIRNIFESDRKCTLVLISHRIPALTRCDRILVMEHGRVTAEGTHQQLARQSGIYRDTWQYQKYEEASG